MSRYNRSLTQLLRDFGYKLEGRTILVYDSCYRTWRVWRTARDLFDACEQLIPIIRDDEFRDRFRNARA